MTGNKELNWAMGKATALVGVCADGTQEAIKDSGYFIGNLPARMSISIRDYAKKQEGARYIDGRKRAGYIFTEAGLRIQVFTGCTMGTANRVSVQWEKDYQTEEECEAYIGKYESTMLPA